MRDLKLLYKYATKTSKPNKSKGKKFGNVINWAMSLFFIVLLAFPMIIMFYEMANMLAVPVSSLGLPYKGYLFDIYMFLYPATFGLMAILTLVPSMVFNVFEADDMTFLLTLPIKRSTIFIFKASMGLFMGVLPLLMLIILGLCYGVAFKLNILLNIIGLLLFMVFIFLFSFTIGSIMARFMKKSTANIFSQIFLYVSIIAYVIVMNVFPRQAENFEAVLDSFGALFGIMEGKYAWIMPTNWFLYAVKGDIRVFILLGLLSIIFAFVIIKATNVFNMDNGRSKSKTKKGIQISRYPIIKKEIRLIFRNPKNIFGISYAIIFPLVFTYINRSILSGAMFVALFSALYTATLSIQLITEEKKSWPFLKLLPIDMDKVIRYKAFIPAIIYTLDYVIVLLVGYLLIDMEPIIFLSIIPMIAVILYSSAFDLNIFLNDPQRSLVGDGFKLKFSESMLIQFGTIILSLGVIIPFQMQTNIKPTSPIWYKILAMGLPWTIMIIAIILVKSTLKKVKIRIETWE